MTTCDTTTYGTLVDFTLDHAEVRRAIADAHHLHRLILSGFDSDWHEYEQSPRATARILHAVDYTRKDRLRALIRSATTPEFNPDLLHAPPRTWTAPCHFDPASRWLFEVRVAPMRRSRRTHSTIERPLYRDPDRHTWLTEKATHHGFSLDTVTFDIPIDLTSAAKSKPRRNRDRPRQQLVTHTMRARGILTVTDPDTFTHAYQHGIGRARAYGAGMLLVRPAP